MNEYATLTEVRNYLSLASPMTSDDSELKRLLEDASRAIDRHCKREFHPRKRTLIYDLPADETIRFEHDVLAVNGLSHLNGASEVGSEVWWLTTGKSYNYTPYNKLVLDDSSGSGFNFSGTPQRAIYVDATTGYHENWSDAWVDTGAVIAANHGSSNTALSIVGEVTASNLFGKTPRIDNQQLMRIGNEYVYAASITNPSHIQIVRGMNGTSQTEHLTGTSGASIFVFQPEWEINYLTIRLAAWQYMQRQSPFSAQLRVAGMGAIEVPESWPNDVKSRVEKYRKKRIYHPL